MTQKKKGIYSGMMANISDDQVTRQTMYSRVAEFDGFVGERGLRDPSYIALLHVAGHNYALGGFSTRDEAEGACWEGEAQIHREIGARSCAKKTAVPNSFAARHKPICQHCDRPAMSFRRLLCKMHYQRIRAHGTHLSRSERLARQADGVVCSV